MKKYRFGDMLNEMKVGRSAILLDGTNRGAIAFVNKENNHLNMLFPDGRQIDSLTLRIRNLGENWVFVDEILFEQTEEISSIKSPALIEQNSLIDEPNVLFD